MVKTQVKDSDPVTVGTLMLTLNQFYAEKLSFLENVAEENKILKSQVQKLTERVEDLEVRLDDQVAYGCRNEIVIHNMPVQDDEDPTHIAKLAGELVGVQIDKGDVDAAHRMASVKLTPPFIMRLVNRFKRDEMMRNAKINKPNAESVGGRRDTKIYFSEHLTKRNRELLFNARVLRNSHYVWTKNGMVMCKEKKENSKAFRIKYIHEIQGISGGVNGAETTESRKRGLDETSPQAPDKLKIPASNGGVNGATKDRFRYDARIPNTN